MTSSGIRFGAFSYFHLRDFIPVDKYGIYKIRVYAGETEEYFTFCTPECRKEIEKYIDYLK
ncbi:MAG: hypothetical protein ACPKQO_01115 [Nitrososphaeraceae archaeon]